MIDLRFPELPSCLECDGIFYRVDTSFRTWIEFDRVLREEHVAWSGIFEDEVPESDGWLEGALEFFESPNETPRTSESDGPGNRPYDLILDGDYIVAAFQQAYGIDLTSCDMHWHRFKALFAGLPEDTKMSRIIGYRTWKKRDKDDDYDKTMAKVQADWVFADKASEEEDRALLEWADMFFDD